MLIAPAEVSAARRRLTVRQVEQLALHYAVPVEDVLLIAVNLFGIRSDQDRHRARLAVRLARLTDAVWQVIVPLNALASPFELHGSDLILTGQVVAQVEQVDADEAVGGYFRNGGRAATLNPNGRSRCVGCAFCPNTLEASADPRLGEEQGLDHLLAALVEQHPRHDLSELNEVTVSTGCFGREAPAVDHLVSLRSALSRHDIRARIGFLTSVVQSEAAFEQLHQQVAPFVLRLTAECFSRRDLLLKASKAQLRLPQMPAVLGQARAAGLDASYTYIVGLDGLPELEDGVGRLQPHINEFPNFQVYQAHNAIMAGLRAGGADRVAFYLEARRVIEAVVGPSGLRPSGWECYRPLWYTTFGGEVLAGAARG